ncbi:MAG: iron-sulfur cluster assembly scaffold protein [Pseudomonadota bacterium]|nr:iron-sulfur cluster assembly scaffold protein [Pseudomonadota bacterium]
MATAAVLYTPEILGLAAGLADFPQDLSLPFVGSARSKSCGSHLTLQLAVGDFGQITRLGISAQACAIGQAATTVFARAAGGRSAADIAAAESGIVAWLAGEGAMPDWPGLAAIAPAAAYPGRHGAILLAWRAALVALSCVTSLG